MAALRLHNIVSHHFLSLIITAFNQVVRLYLPDQAIGCFFIKQNNRGYKTQDAEKSARVFSSRYGLDGPLSFFTDSSVFRPMISRSRGQQLAQVLDMSLCRTSKQPLVKTTVFFLKAAMASHLSRA
jgi:hypothetical protein